MIWAGVVEDVAGLMLAVIDRDRGLVAYREAGLAARAFRRVIVGGGAQSASPLSFDLGPVVVGPISFGR